MTSEFSSTSMSGLVCYVLGVETKFRGNGLLAKLKQQDIEALPIYGDDASTWTKSDLMNLQSKSASFALNMRTLSSGECACVMVHRKAYTSFLDTGGKWCMVLEDDALIDFTIEDIKILVEDFGSSPTIILLFHNDPSEVPSISKVAKKHLLLELCDFIPFGTVGYIMNRSAAQIAVDAYRNRKIDSTADWPYRWRNKINFWKVTPQLVNHPEQDDDSESLIAHARQIQNTESSNIYNRLMRFLAGVSGIRALIARFHGVSFIEIWLRDLRMFILRKNR